ncbi:transcription initiation factor IIB [Candidatus Bathyarchaeota archaeon]|nr:transcription initiation factor IIB [Candidatus Bathyarchaeota archaeon]MBT4320800.1 transcription initiation factor IIB [Candidatus Bathyarchaeota archaeon]MBT4423074.1 transcription initiation factor IIB [Candidatus Bathyarchaeota archaeon]MBT5642471.1 transcription initiation factor IIB [Candidatus Bathyarchaeota archaeon]MBT6605459.1 transcription initiation factor IIB [Candidatus Bathyarchaeota archaeon]
MRGHLSSKLKKETICTDCGNSNLLRDYETGELVCQACGIVVSDALLATGPEWRAFDQEQRDKLPRVGAPVTWTIHDKGLSTTIGWQDRDASGRKLSPEERARLYRLRKWHRRSKVSDSTQRNLAHALSEMSKISYKLNLPRNVIETSSMIYRRAIQKQLIRGRTIQSVAVASIYMACRQCGVIRTLEDVAGAANITKKEAARNYRFLLRELKPSVPQVNPRGYISKIVNKLALSGETERLAMSILNQASEMKLTSGRGPSGIAAACIYISSQLTDERRTQGEIAKEAQVTEVTIRNRYKELAQRLDFCVTI